MDPLLSVLWLDVLLSKSNHIIKPKTANSFIYPPTMGGLSRRGSNVRQRCSRVGGVGATSGAPNVKWPQSRVVKNPCIWTRLAKYRVPMIQPNVADAAKLQTTNSRTREACTNIGEAIHPLLSWWGGGGGGGTCGPNGYITLAILGAHMWPKWQHSHLGVPQRRDPGGGYSVVDANYPPN